MSLSYQYYATLETEELIHGDIVAESKDKATKMLHSQHPNILKLTIWLKGSENQEYETDRDILLALNQRIERIDKIVRWAAGITIVLFILAITFR